MTGPTVGLALIVKNEEHNLPRLLKSVEGAFDQIVMVDTGSTDRTKQVFREWAETDPADCEVAHFEWCDDFAAVRNYADRLVKTDWRVWADADDEIQGAQNLRALAAQAPPELAAFVADYHYAHDHHDNVVCVLRRERLVRRGTSTWVGRVHEAQIFPQGGGTAQISPETCVWVHGKTDQAPASGERNLRILRAWNEAEPDNPRVVGYLGTEIAVTGDYEQAIQHFEHYLTLDPGWDEERAQIHRKLAICLLATGRPADALTVALDAFRVLPDWPDTPLTLAEATYHLGEYANAEKWARRVLDHGMPDSLLILNPLDYTFRPRLVLAGALGAQGRISEAVTVAQEALQLVPDDPNLNGHLRVWRGTLKRDQTAQSWIAAAQMLVTHDEQLKALTLLERTVPHYAQDHPQIVALRSHIRERLLWVRDPGLYAEHYATGGSKPEDGVPDEKVIELCERLPRAQFLKRGITEQLAEAS